MASRGTANADRRRGSTEKKKDAERERRARKALAEGRTPGQPLPPTEAQWRQIVIDSVPPDDEVIRRAEAEEEPITMF